jgi:branched-chain amino acid transport system ATP-binding protein
MSDTDPGQGRQSEESRGVDGATSTGGTDGSGVSSDGAETDAVLRTENLTRSFGEVVAVDDVSIGVERGELRAIIGPNGAGKTTLFNCVTGALPPTEGRILLQGEDVTDEPEHDRPHVGLARSFQSNELFRDQTVLENVRLVVQTAREGPFSLDLFRDHRTVGRERALELLERVGLTADPDTVAKNLPHGDQRRLGIAMALATDPDVLLLDEPTSGMSPGATAGTADLIERIQSTLGITLVLIEHDMDVVLSISDRITVLNRGRVVATGTPAEVREDPDVQDAYLGGMREEI